MENDGAGCIGFAHACSSGMRNRLGFPDEQAVFNGKTSFGKSSLQMHGLNGYPKGILPRGEILDYGFW